MSERDDTKTGGPRDGRELLLLRAGARDFAVFAEEVEAVAEGLRPAPLPHAPRAVLGVVCVRGRMRTLLDPLALVANKETQSRDDDGDANAVEVDEANAVEDVEANAVEDDDASAGEENVSNTTPRLVVALRGDEQLALAVEEVAGTISVRQDELAAPVDPEDVARPVRATLKRDGALVQLLDCARLFDAAMRGTERRRRRQ